MVDIGHGLFSHAAATRTGAGLPAQRKLKSATTAGCTSCQFDGFPDERMIDCRRIPANMVPDLASQAGLPSMYLVSNIVQAGGLISYGPDFLALFRRGAHLVDRILKGAKPADLPIEQPSKFLLAINLKTAKSLGLDIPPSLLARADEVYE